MKIKRSAPRQSILPSLLLLLSLTDKSHGTPVFTSPENFTHLPAYKNTNSAGPSSSSSHHNAGFINSAGIPFELEYADPARTILKASGTHYNFTDLVSLSYFTNQTDDASVPDIDYYEFSEANLAASQHSLFYALWSITAQAKPEYAQLGEWGLFAAEYMGTRNSRCGGDDSHCKEKMSLSALKAQYPGQRALVRLIHFTGLKMSLLHDIHVGVEKHMHRTHTNLIGRLPTLIKSFTHQPDLTKLMLCKLAHTAIETSAQLSLKFATFGLSAFLDGKTPNLEFVFGTYRVFETFMADLLLFRGPLSEYQQRKYNYMAGSFDMWYKNMSPAQRDSYPALRDGPKPTIISFDPQSILVKEFPKWAMAAAQITREKFTHDLNLDQGYNNGLLCGAWEGDDEDRSPANIQRLAEHMSTYFDNLERATRDMYRELIEGRVLVPGHPTLMALYGMNLKWAGEASVLETLRDMEPLKTAISNDLEKRLISTASRNDGNWQLCVHRYEAPRLCERARLGREGRLPRRENISDAMKSLVCADPVNDPSLVCQGGRWYWNKYLSHVIPFAGLKNFESYHGGRLNLTYETAVMEAYANFKNFGNEMDSPNIESWSLGHVSGNGLRMPICKAENDFFDIKDFSSAPPHLREERQWQFPGVCGSVGNDTEAFLDAIKTGYKSQNWEAKDGKSLALYHDRLPRIYSRLSPYLSYMSYGRAGLQFPIKDPNPSFWGKTANAIKMTPSALHNWWQVTNARDADFEKIRELTAGMTEFEGNMWFCLQGKDAHTVFQRERGHADLMATPARIVDNHAKKCKKWLKQNKVEV